MVLPEGCLENESRSSATVERIHGSQRIMFSVGVIRKHPMSHQKKLAFLRTKVIQISATTSVPRAELPINLRPPKSNQTLKWYLKTNSTMKALFFFRQLLRQNPSAVDSYSLMFVLKACTLVSSSTGRQLHAIVKKLGLEPIIFLQTCLVDLYSMMGNLGGAHQIFDEIPRKNTVCWTSLISAYANNNKHSKALKLFMQMQVNNVEPDQVTLTVALAACASLGALAMGEWIHAYIRRSELKADLCLNNALINMYVKCGGIEKARTLFCSVMEKDVTTWTSMIVGHALYGQAEDALELFAKMTGRKYGADKSKDFSQRSMLVVPNNVTFLGVLMACSHAGMVEEGKRHFRSMIHGYGLKPTLSHFGCMVDLLCRSGFVREAYDFILGMPVHPNAVIWRTLLGACFLHGKVELGEEARRQLFGLEPAYAGDDIALCNMYAANGLWTEKMMTRDRLKYRRAPGCSLIEAGSEIN
ncbi:hypothetical protein Nepgr_003215 [Nepenthes gracilis]|uniref:Pentatricopeptide repeat-containing protein n=1 Tax=Nepenthes gracilis TaxID=150966 RepID=A0AAD3RZ27_NEPGR|nr:hypothetical protein Nepgr_003215 [Nepenthes gracilis]